MSPQPFYPACALTPEGEWSDVMMAIALTRHPSCLVERERSWVKLLASEGMAGAVATLALADVENAQEALLLCQQSHATWLAWMPDQGEMILHQQDFYLS